ncbi:MULTISPECIES: hypothetical protein [unclassified Sutcliffiella]|uniref:hypothetical protein n=1 Tax=unclassified Sutcliffiella TaxID=2837532 RepID=UPI0030D25B73
MLQARINELKSAIIDIHENKVYITGFTREEMLISHLETGTESFYSRGLYDYQELHFHEIKNDALFIVRKTGKEVGRHQYKAVHKDTIQYKNEEGKDLSLTFTIRKSTYSDHFHFSSEKLSVLFSSRDELNNYLQDNFKVHIGAAL